MQGIWQLVVGEVGMKIMQVDPQDPMSSSSGLVIEQQTYSFLYFMCSQNVDGKL